MQTTNPGVVPASARQRRRGLALALYFVALFVVVDVLASFCLGSYASLSAVAWSDFRDALASGQKVSTVFVGSSYGERAFDTVAFDNALQAAGAADDGLSFNLCTPGQSLAATEDTVDAAIDAGARRIVLSVGVESLRDYRNCRSDVPYVLARHEGDTLGTAAALGRIAVREDVIGTRDSLGVACPWVFSSVRGFSGLRDNVMSRLTGESKGTAAEKQIGDWRYVGRGYGNYDRVLAADDHDTTVGTYGYPWVNADAVAVLDALCQRCEEAGVELVVVSTPHPAYDVATMGQGYVYCMNTARTTVESHGGRFFDFNFASKDVLVLEREDYSDFEHLGFTGAAKFSTALAQVVADAESGADVSDRFVLPADYEGFDQWLASHAGWEV